MQTYFTKSILKLPRRTILLWQTELWHLLHQGYLPKKMPELGLPKYLEVAPQDNTTLANRALASFTVGNPDEALALYDKALKINPNDTGVLVDKGVLLDDSGQLDEALALYEKSIETTPYDTLALNDKG